MNIQESAIVLNIYEQGGFKPRFEKDGSRCFEGPIGEHTCSKKINLGPAFIAHALKDPGPAYDLKVLKSTDNRRKYFRLSTNMKLHLHVKKMVADYKGVDFGGNLDCFTWTLI